jgi:5-methyltetrahydropteroyltriglutamate--homocysteine methyltransferase
MAMDKPFFRADQVGSLLRPAALLTAREQHAQGRLDAAGLRRVEDAAIQQVVRLQEECGFEVVVDGEFRRENWWIDFVRGLEGVAIQDGVARQTFVAPGSTEAQLQDKPKSSDAKCGHDHDHDWTYVPKNVVTTGKLGAPHPVTVADFTSLQSVSSGLAKITLPSPTRLHFHGGRDSVSAVAYPDIEDFFDDVVKLYRAEIAALEAAGCRYIQIDDPLMSYFISDRMRAEVRASGDDPDLRLGRYVRLLNDCVAERSAWEIPAAAG